MNATTTRAEEDARYVLRWIERNGNRSFTKRDAQQHGKRRFPRADDIDEALAELTNRGYIRQQPSHQTGAGRPPSPTYEANPLVFDAREKRAHNSHKLGTGSDAQGSENIENAIDEGQQASCDVDKDSQDGDEWGSL